MFIIPARGGSKGIPGKNIKPLCSVPLLEYSIAYARRFVPDDRICLSTDYESIIRCAKKAGLKVPFIRPAYLATDTAGSYAVIRHACQFYQQAGRQFDCIVLLQPTSPFRKKQHLEEAISTYKPELDMVVSVVESEANPYFNLFEESPGGWLEISKGESPFATRQGAPRVYKYNGSLYLINPVSLMKQEGFGQFRSVKKYVMGAEYSLDLDTPEDWEYAEYLCTGRFRDMFPRFES